MKKIDIGQVIAILANLGVIAGIVFLAYQMRQSQSIALSEMAQTIVANQIEIGNAIAANAKVWVRGNSGAQLDAAEAAVFASLVRNVNDAAYYQIQVDHEMGLARAESVDVAEFALYLHRNPGAFESWLEREKELSTYRGLLNPVFASGWRSRVLSAIEVFKKHESVANTKDH